jgi:hypothetical protein
MSRRTTGTIFIVVAAVLYSTNYLAAAIFGSGVSSWNSDLFRAMLQYTNQGLSNIIWLSLLAGIAYLAWAELGEILKNKGN